MKKQELLNKYEELQGLLNSIKGKNTIKDEALAMLDSLKEDAMKAKEPKGPSKPRQQATIVNEETGETLYWCRYHKVYYRKEDMVFSKDKSKGYCKAAIAEWNRRSRYVKKLQDDMVEYIEQDKKDELETTIVALKEAKASLLVTAHFDIDADWKRYNEVKQGKNTQEVENENLTQE